ncbi:ABC transporter ATP-binding protein [Scytonema millei]|uniref:ABC transporter ATP-binding protein n=1 Tax=Scytonema millei TaxID=1245922 RepID=UPI000B093166|nr:ABC transporter ATP-binding protein [Scytonema millei]
MTHAIAIQVALENVSKIYGKVQAVQSVSLDVQQGEFFTLLGASGSGKTTLLRLIGGFETPDTGCIYIGGKDVSRLPAYKRNVHTVFQDYALFPHLSVFDNVAYALQAKRSPVAEISQRVTEALKLVQLAEMAQRLPSQLSGGQKQRVALARAIVDRPDVLLLDEPLSALDAKIRMELRQELKQLQRQTGISFVYITHDQEEALALSDRIAILKSGKLLQVGTPLEVYEQPADLYVAEFIGRANFLDGVLLSVDGQRGRVQIGETAIVEGTVVEGAIATISPGNAVRLVVRPENICLNRADIGYAATIIQSQYLGYATSYLVQAIGLNFHVTELRRRGTSPYKEGERVFISWEWMEALIFSS